MLVFRENAQLYSSRDLERGLQAAINRASSGTREALLDALLRAGELECGSHDARDENAAAVLAQLTERLAECLISGRAPSNAAEWLRRASLSDMPVRISPPEGFAYYALHPLDYAELASSLTRTAAALAGIGIRRIGT